jgi:hypothetical protein
MKISMELVYKLHEIIPSKKKLHEINDDSNENNDR